MEIILSSEMEIYICPSSPREELIHLLPEQMGHITVSNGKKFRILKGKVPQDGYFRGLLKSKKCYSLTA